MSAPFNVIQVKHHKVPRLFVGTKKWQSVRRQNGSGSVEICREKVRGQPVMVHYVDSCQNS